MSGKIAMYRFKVSLAGWRAEPISKLHRIIDVEGNAPFAFLHDLIFEAFDRHDAHLFTFLLTREDKKGMDMMDCKEEVRLIDDFVEDFADEKRTVHDAVEYTVADAGLQEKDIIYYWFDFGDDWIHRLRLEKIYYIEDTDPEGEGWYGDVMKKVGISPPQYDETEEEED